MGDSNILNKSLHFLGRYFKRDRTIYSELFNSITENPLIGVYILQDNKFKYVSKGWCIITGYSSEETVGKMRTMDIVVPSDELILKEYVTKRMSGNTNTSDNRFRIIRKDGSLAHVKVYGNLIQYKSKNAVAGILIDISQQSAIESNLQENEEKYRNLVENSLVGVYLIQDNRFKYANNYFCEIFGYQPHEIINNIDPALLVHDDDKSMVAGNLEKRLTGKASLLKYEFKGLKKDDSIVYVQVLGTVMQYKGRPAVMGSLINITELKETTEALKESEHLFETLLNLAPYPISVTDKNLKHIIVNNSFCKTFKVTVDEVLNKTPNELGFIVKDEDSSMIKESMLKNKHVDNIETSLYDKKGNKKHFLYSCLEFKYKDGDLILNTFVDITEQNNIKEELSIHKENLEILVKQRTSELNVRNEELKRANKQLKDQKKDLQKTLTNLHTTQQQLIQSEKMASLGFLSAGIAHEINNPLNFIQGGSLAIEQILEESSINNKEEAKIYLNAINEGVRRTSDIVSSLNHYSRSNDKDRVSCQVNNIIHNCLTMLKSKISGSIQIIKDLDLNLPEIQANEGQLHQVFLNIINNSLQAANHELAEIKINTSADNKYVNVQVVDNGEGIPKGILKNVFDPFYTTKEPGEGTGLGLSISYNIIKEHKGSIKIDSEPGKWTKTEILLPIK